MEIPDGLMDPSATAQNMCTFIGFLGPCQRGRYCHFGRSNSRKMQAKTGPVVPFVIRECRYCAGRADVESVAAPVKILSPTRKWLLRPSFRLHKTRTSSMINRQGENCVSKISFQKMGEVVFGTGIKLCALISLNLERNYPISSKSGHMPFLWRFSS